MLEFFMSKPAKQLYWICQGNTEKLKACYRNEGLLPETEKALLGAKNRAVLLKFLKWGRFKEVANELRLILLHIERPKEIEAYFCRAKSPETEEALLEPKNRAVLLKFLKWGRFKEVANELRLIVLHIEHPKEIEAYFCRAKSPKTEEALLKPKNRAVLGQA